MASLNICSDSRVDYLKDFGIDVIWLSPTYKSPMDDWGYDISDYEDIEQRFGTLQDMENLIDEVHKRGMKLLLDLVITHTSVKHKWFEDSAMSGEKKDWYMWADKRPGNMIQDQLVEEPTNWRAAFGGSAWRWVPARGQFYLHLFLESQPDLNWENPEVREQVYESAVKFWVDHGVDGFRVDTGKQDGALKLSQQYQHLHSAAVHQIPPNHNILTSSSEPLLQRHVSSRCGECDCRQVAARQPILHQRSQDARVVEGVEGEDLEGHPGERPNACWRAAAYTIRGLTPLCSAIREGTVHGLRL